MYEIKEEISKSQTKRADLIFPELSYQIVGILFDVYKEMGNGFQEKQYQRAVATELAANNLKFEEQVHTPLLYKGKEIGKYFLDFLIDDKVVLEIKKDKYFSRKNIEQTFAYLKVTGLKLGILANFTKDGLKFKRIINVV